MSFADQHRQTLRRTRYVSLAFLVMAIVVGVGATADVIFGFGWGNDAKSVSIALVIAAIAFVIWAITRFVGYVLGH